MYRCDSLSSIASSVGTPCQQHASASASPDPTTRRGFVKPPVTPFLEEDNDGYIDNDCGDNAGSPCAMKGTARQLQALSLAAKKAIISGSGRASADGTSLAAGTTAATGIDRLRLPGVPTLHLDLDLDSSVSTIAADDLSGIGDGSEKDEDNASSCSVVHRTRTSLTSRPSFISTRSSSTTTSKKRVQISSDAPQWISAPALHYQEQPLDEETNSEDTNSSSSTSRSAAGSWWGKTDLQTAQTLARRTAQAFSKNHPEYTHHFTELYQACQTQKQMVDILASPSTIYILSATCNQELAIRGLELRLLQHQQQASSSRRSKESSMRSSRSDPSSSSQSPSPSSPLPLPSSSPPVSNNSSHKNKNINNSVVARRKVHLQTILLLQEELLEAGVSLDRLQPWSAQSSRPSRHLARIMASADAFYVRAMQADDDLDEHL